MWVPRFNGQNQPVYLMIADAIERDIASAKLSSGDRLPTLKELAEALKVTPGTVGRAYDEASKRGLVVGEVGRGTFVSQKGQASAKPSAAYSPQPRAETGRIDLSIIKPNDSGTADWLREAVIELAQAPGLATVLDYTTDGGHAVHKEAGAIWLQNRLPEANWQQVVLTSGAQHGLLVAIASLSNNEREMRIA